MTDTDFARRDSGAAGGVMNCPICDRAYCDRFTKPRVDCRTLPEAIEAECVRKARQADALDQLAALSQEFGSYDEPEDTPGLLPWWKDKLGELRTHAIPEYDLHVCKTTTGRGWRFNVLHTADTEADHMYRSGYPSQYAAVLACEAALLRLGLLPLPDLESGEVLRGYTTPVQERFADGSPAPVRFWGWRVARVGNYTVAAGECESEDAARSAAERHLRAELAAWLDAQAATEGV